MFLAKTQTWIQPLQERPLQDILHAFGMLELQYSSTLQKSSGLHKINRGEVRLAKL